MRFNSSCSATHLFISLLFLFQLPKHNYSSFDHSPQALDSLLWHASSSAVNPQKKGKPHGMQPSASTFFYIIYILPALLPTLYKMVLGLPLLKAASFQWMQPFMPFQTAIFSGFPLAMMVFHYVDLLPLTLGISAQASQVFTPQANFLTLSFLRVRDIHKM